MNCSRHACYATESATNWLNNESHTIMDSNQFAICDDLLRHSVRYCVLELFNYLDIYLDFSFVNII